VVPDEPAIAFAAEPADVGAPFELRVNFGVFAGRAATAAELDDLARRLLFEVETVSVVAEERHEVGDGAEAVLHQVRIELDPGELPADHRELEELKGRLVDAAERWARACATTRHAPEAEL
jgi:hypothetical protein